MKSKYLRNIITLFSSAVFAQVLAFFLTPILTRIYSPESFGIFTAFVSYSSTLAVFLFLSAELGIVQEKYKRGFESVLGLMVLIASVSLFVLIITLYFESEFFSFIGFDRLFDIKAIVVLGVVFAGMNLILHQVITRNGQFSLYAGSQVSFVVLRFVVSFLFFYFGVVEYGLVFGFVIATFLIVIYLSIKTQIYKARPSIELANVTLAAKKYKQLILYNTPSNFLNMMLVNFPVFFILKNYGIEAAGLFGLAFRMAMLPVALVNKAVGQVLYKRFTESKEHPELLFGFVVKNIFMLSAASPAFIILFVFGESLFSFVFGDQWLESGTLASLMSPYIFFSFLVSPLSYYFVAFNKSKLLLMISGIFLLILIGLILVVDIATIESFIIYYSIVNVAYYVTVLLTVLISIKPKGATSNAKD